MARNKFDVDENLESPFNFAHLKRAMKYVKKHAFKTVSYTHLTLPTILLV